MCYVYLASYPSPAALSTESLYLVPKVLTTIQACAKDLYKLSFKLFCHKKTKTPPPFCMTSFRNVPKHYQPCFRRRDIEDQFMFLCECDRCKDGSEMGSKLGGIHCSTCSNGILIPREPLKSEESDWICDKCGSEMSGMDCTDKIKFLNNHIQGAIEDSKGSIQVYEFVSTNKTCFNKFQDCSSRQFPSIQVVMNKVLCNSTSFRVLGAPESWSNYFFQILMD